MKLRNALTVIFIICGSLTLSAQSPLSELHSLLSDMSKNESFNKERFKDMERKCSEQEKFILYSKLRTYYCEKYLSENTVSLEEPVMFINSYFTDENRLGYFTFCTERQIFNSYTASEYDYFHNSHSTHQDDYKLTDYAEDLYSGLYLYKHNCTTENDYRLCAELLDRALTFKPNDTLYPILEECLKKSYQLERLFYLSCYRLYDRDNNVSFFDKAQLYLQYKKINKPSSSFSQLCQNVKQQIINDTIVSFTPKLSYPDIKELHLTDSSGSDVLLNVNDNLTRNDEATRIMIVFFSVTCHNCINEMNILSKMTETLRSRNIKVIAVYTMYNNEQSYLSELSAFETEHKYQFPVYADLNRNKLSGYYYISSVPSMMLIDKDGSVVGIGSFSHYGLMQDKILTLTGMFNK